jgi:hypothetical protein
MKIGDRVVLMNSTMSFLTAEVVNVIYDPTEDRTRIDLDWGVHGKSRVYAHDEGVVWCKVENYN